MRAELERQLQLDFPFMQQNEAADERNTYRRWGCQCGDGWFGLIHDLCQSIAERYERAGKSVDIIVVQVKEKFATLRFYYEFEDAPCIIHAFDSLDQGLSVRYAPQDGADEVTRQLRKNIAEIVRAFEKKSGTVCEVCGATGEIRKDLPRKKTLCFGCYSRYLKGAEERKRRLKDRKAQSKVPWEKRPLCFQMAEVGGEVSRALRSQDKPDIVQGHLQLACGLLARIIEIRQDEPAVVAELSEKKDILCDYFGENLKKTQADDLKTYYEKYLNEYIESLSEM